MKSPVLKALLGEIEAGKRDFRSSGKTEADYQAFQTVVETLTLACHEGYLEGLREPLHRENETGKRYIDVVRVKGGLTDKGKAYLTSASSQ